MKAGMRNLVLLALLATTAGCQRLPCGGCADYETCSAVADQCVLNDGARFDLEAVDGNVPGDNWDPFFGPPDPYICASGQGQAEQCSPVDSDTHSPSWKQVLLSDLDGATLLAEPLEFRYEDSDLDSDDLVCQGPLTLQNSLINDGGFSFHCNNGSYANFALHNTVKGTPAL
jgi:hypothetical protein